MRARAKLQVFNHSKERRGKSCQRPERLLLRHVPDLEEVWWSDSQPLSPPYNGPLRSKSFARRDRALASAFLAQALWNLWARLQLTLAAGSCGQVVVGYAYTPGSDHVQEYALTYFKTAFEDLFFSITARPLHHWYSVPARYTTPVVRNQSEEVSCYIYHRFQFHR